MQDTRAPFAAIQSMPTDPGAAPAAVKAAPALAGKP